MPAKVPTSAAPIRWPSTSGDWSSAPIALMTPSTAATMPSAGKRLRDRHHRVIGLELVVLDGLDLLVHQRLDLVRAGIADDDQAAVVADERQSAPRS